MFQVDSSQRIDQFRELASYGFQLIPVWGLTTDPDGNRICACRKGKFCKTPGKHPPFTNWGARSTSDPDRIAEMYINGFQNAGIVTGEPSRIVVADIDPRNSGQDSLADLERQYGPFPKTVTIDSGGGGTHLYFRHPGRPVSNFKNKLPGIDFRGDGGMVVAPGSLHKSGNSYRFRAGLSPNDIEVAEAPEWFFELLERKHEASVGPGSSMVVRAVQKLLIEHDLYADTTERGYGTVLNLIECPTASLLATGEPHHVDGSYVLVTPNGSVIYHCHHDDCRGKGTAEFLKALGESTIPLPDFDSGLGEKAIIAVDSQDLAGLTQEAWVAVEQHNEPPTLFLVNSGPVRLNIDEGRVQIQTVTESILGYELAEAADFTRTKSGRNGITQVAPVFPPKEIVSNMLASPKLPLPKLDRIVHVPVFARDGKLVVEPGFSNEAGIYYSPPPGFFAPRVQPRPSSEDMQLAKDLIDELLCDFPFVSQADKAGAIGLMLLPYVRDLITGPTPIHLIEAPKPGNGKDLLADVLLRPALGRQPSTITEGANGEELAKRLTAELRKHPDVLQIANVTKPINSGALAQAVTTGVYTERILGESRSESWPVRCIWVITGNNPIMSTEIARRTTRIRIDARVERPWERREFQHPDLLRWVMSRQTNLAWAGLTLAQHWLSDGKVSGSTTLGSFEEWSKVIGGILLSAGIPGFLTNLPDFYADSDFESSAWTDLVAVWWEKHLDEPVTSGQIFDLIEERGIDGIELSGSYSAMRKQFGFQLKGKRDTIINNYEIQSTKGSGNQNRYRLKRLSGPPTKEERERQPSRGHAADSIFYQQRMQDAALRVEGSAGS